MQGLKQNTKSFKVTFSQAWLVSTAVSEGFARRVRAATFPHADDTQRISSLEYMYQPERWHEAFSILGTSSAAIAGLIIVAASVRADQLMATPHWRMRALNSTLGMIAITIGAILVVLPQDSTVLGIELIAINLINACLLPGPVILNALRNRTRLLMPLWAVINLPLLVVSLYFLAVAGGVSLIVHWGGGLYLTLVAHMGILLTAVTNAYALLLPHPKSSKR